MARGKLKGALDRYRGRDQKLERQKKLQKDAQKRKKTRTLQVRSEHELPAPEEELESAVSGGIEDAAADGEDQWATDSDDSENGDELEIDPSRIYESDSDSDSADEDGDDTEDAAAAGAPLKSILKPSTRKQAQTKLANGATDREEEQDDVDEEDIPLSDLSAASNSDEEQDIIPHQRLTINNTAALERARASIALPLSTLAFSDHQSLTTSEPVNIPDANDDLNRELAFYSQSLKAVQEGRSLLQREGVPFTRPNDYFAEMVKSDEHMGMIKGKLVADAASRKAAAEARRQRDLKKFGKQVQQEKLKERAKEKKATMEKVSALKRKRQGAGLDTGGEREDDLFDVALDDAAAGERGQRGPRGGARGGRGGGRGRGNGDRSAKRQKKDDKFGFGGKKRFKKSGDAASSGDMRGYSVKRMKGQSRGGAAKRPGKSRREKMR